MHYTPIYSSWINQVERWFGYLTDQLIRRGDHHSAQALETDIRAWVDAKEVADLLRMEPQWVPDRVTRKRFDQAYSQHRQTRTRTPESSVGQKATDYGKILIGRR